MHHKTLHIFFVFLSFLVYAAFGAPVQSSQGHVSSHSLAKRKYNTVHQAVHGIHHKVGAGMTGEVFALKHTYKGHPAVVKVINKVRTPTAGDPATEAQNLHHVDQLLGWGHDTTHGKDTHYLVMKNMGVPARKTGLNNDDIISLNKEAEVKYDHQFGMENRDRNGNNYVYRGGNGHWKAEIVDWARASHTKQHNPPNGFHPEPVRLGHSGRRKCPTCVIG
ncbi:hypothetical protein BDZ97DRAFT_1762663 [Flammula alnicola]|nr:hypothetical protein BDZ97DRAFT_1762663 [Flammula alnicola]